MFGSPSSNSALSESADTAAPVRPRGWLSGAGLSNLGCGASPNPCGLGSTNAGLSNSARCSPSGWTSGREALDLGPEDLGPEADFRGAGMSGIWGESGTGGRATAEYVAPVGPRLELRVLLSTSYRHPGEGGFNKLLISPAISGIKESAADSKGHSGRGTL